MYKFGKQLAKGEHSEAILDSVFNRDYAIARVNMDMQRKGIDRIFTHRRTRAVLNVEYKTDWTASRTHNAFVETVSVDTQNKPGWAVTSQADILIYYVPGDEIVYVIRLGVLRGKLDDWRKFPTRRIPNDGYHTVGLLVPLAEFERIAVEVLSL